jgi:hypothetical protein
MKRQLASASQLDVEEAELVGVAVAEGDGVVDDGGEFVLLGDSSVRA